MDGSQIIIRERSKTNHKTHILYNSIYRNSRNFNYIERKYINSCLGMERYGDGREGVITKGCKKAFDV